MDMLHEARPDIIGGTIAIDADGFFTQTMAFRTEAEAREGEQKSPPPEAQQEMDADERDDERRQLPRPAPPVVRHGRRALTPGIAATRRAGARAT